MSLALATLTVATTLCLPLANASPTNRNANDSNSSGSTVVVIALVSVGVLITVLTSIVIHRHRQQREQGRDCNGVGATRKANTRRTTIGYTGIAERTGNARIETWGAETRTNDISVHSTRQTHHNRRPTHDSTRSLPLYNERPPNGEVVLLQRIPSQPDDRDGHSRHETENTSSAGAAPAYTDSNTAPSIPVVTITATGSPRSSSSSAESLRGQLENPGSGATTIASSINVVGCEHTDAEAHTVGIPGAITNTVAPPRGDVPTYEEATLTVTSSTNEVADSDASRRAEQRT